MTPLLLSRRTLLTLPAAAWCVPAGATDTAVGVHGMVLFGGQHGLYASHLPMFHAPHDHQLVLQVALADGTLDRQLRDILAREPARWTLVPERFDLLRLFDDGPARLRYFVADVVQGHFERGGTLRHARVPVVVQQVLLHRRLRPPLPAAAPRSEFVVLGQGHERFALKLIDSRPDFDAIVALRAHGLTTRPQRFSIAKPNLGPPSTPALARAASQALGATVQVRALIHHETDDLV